MSTEKVAFGAVVGDAPHAAALSSGALSSPELQHALQRVSRDGGTVTVSQELHFHVKPASKPWITRRAARLGFGFLGAALCAGIAVLVKKQNVKITFPIPFIPGRVDISYSKVG